MPLYAHKGEIRVQQEIDTSSYPDSFSLPAIRATVLYSKSQLQNNNYAEAEPEPCRTLYVPSRRVTLLQFIKHLLIFCSSRYQLYAYLDSYLIRVDLSASGPLAIQEPVRKMSVTDDGISVKKEILKSILSGETVYLEPEHYDGFALSVLTERAEVSPSGSFPILIVDPI
jgi:hypothetical protein